MVRCAGCGFAMSGTTYKRKGKDAVRIYSCRRNHGGGRCPAPATVQADLLEPHVEEAFWRLVEHLELRPVKDVPELAEAEHELAEAEADLAWWAGNTEARATFGEAAYLEGGRVRRERVERARERVAVARRAATGIDLPPAAELRKRWADWPVAVRRRHLAAVVETAMVRRGRGLTMADRVRVLRRGEAPPGLPGKGRSAVIRSFDELFV